MRYFDNSPFKTNKIKDLFINSDTRNTNNSDEYLSVIRDVGVIKYSERSDSGNKTSDSPEKYKMVDVGDLVINPMNVTIGSVGVSEYSGCLSGVYLVLKPKTSVNSKYYHYLFHDKGFQKYLKTISYGIMEIRESLNKTEFFQFKIPKPSVDEQKEIVSYLDKKTNQINELIRKIEQKIELLKEQRNSLINQVVTKGLNHNVEMKDSGVEWIREIPSHWTKSKVRYITKDHRQGYYSSDDYTEKGLRVVRITDLNNDRSIDTKNSPFYELNDLEKENFLLKNGDFLFPRTGGVGRFGIFHSFEPCIYGSFLIRFRFTERVTNKYLRYYFDSELYLNQILSKIHGGVNQNVHVDNIKECKIFYPNKNEQEQIVEYLDDQTQKIDEIILNEEKRIKFLMEYKKSLISEVVTGKKRVV